MAPRKRLADKKDDATALVVDEGAYYVPRMTPYRTSASASAATTIADASSSVSSGFVIGMSIFVGVIFSLVVVTAALGIYYIRDHASKIDSIVAVKGDSGADGVNGVDGADGVKGDSGADGVNGVDGVNATANCTDGVDGVNGTNAVAPAVYIDSEYPCNCTTDLNGTNACVDGTVWQSTAHQLQFVCVTQYGEWWSTESHDARGENADGTICSAGDDPSNEVACTLAWGAGIGSGGRLLGRYFQENWTITGVAYADNGGGDASCSGGASSFDIELWASTAPATVNFTFSETVAAQQSDSRLVVTGLNIPVPGDLFATFGVDNNCGGALAQFVMTITYRITPVSYWTA